MLFGKEEYFAKEHFENNKGYAPSYLCELVVYCLEFVSQLSGQNLKYRFKGGNSLLIILDEPQRFSIDVDIVTETPKEELTKIVDYITTTCPKFIKYEVRQHKTKPWLPMISYKIYFNSFYQTPEDSYIMLDALIEENSYPGTEKKIKAGEIYESNMNVEVPVIEGLLADKLLTIGPSTLGIPLNKNKEAQRLKHIFDVSRLLLIPKEKNIDKIKQYIDNCIKQENELQKSTFELKEIIEDTIKFCSLSLKYQEKPNINNLKKEDNPYLYEIVKGFDDFKKHLFRIDYKWQDFQEHCNLIIGFISKLTFK